MPVKNEHGLSPQMDAFALNMVGGDMSASDAYRKAYPKTKDWKPKTVNEAASRLMSNSKIRARIAELQKKAAEVAVLNAKDVLEEVRRVAHSDIGGIMTADGKIKLPHELDPVTRASVASFKIDEFGRIEYKFWPKTTALEQAMKHLGLYEKDHAQQAPVIGTVRLVGVRPKKGADD